MEDRNASEFKICPQNVHIIRGSIGQKWDVLASFSHVRPIFFNDLAGKNLAPKAEVTGSNPVGCANDFNGLCYWFEGGSLDYFRVTPKAAVPSVWNIRIAQVL
jgi:hypothetical protein